jgi:hypothetical protein
MKKEKEIWVNSYYFPEIYEVSNLARVRNKSTKIFKKISYNKKTGYGSLNLRYKGKHMAVRINRLVYFSFFSATPLTLSIHHKDKNKTNNILTNLESVDHKLHSSLHAQERIAAGTFCKFPKGKDNIKYKGRVVALIPGTFEVKHILNGKLEMEKLGFSTGSISHCVNGRRKTCRGFAFKRISDDLNVEIGQIFDINKECLK